MHPDGAELLTCVAEQYPDTMRFILSGHSDEDAAKRSLSVAHQFLSKPCDGQVLTGQLTMSLRLKQQVHNPLITRTISRIETLPSLPKLYQKVQEISRSEQAGIREVAEIVSQDVGMSAKILQLVNSSFFSLAREVSGVHQAVSLLGMETLKSLVLTVGVFQDFVTSRSLPGLSFHRLVDHCAACGAVAKQIAHEETEDDQLAEHALSAGLLHDLGKLILATKLPDLFADTLQTAHEDQRSICETELESDGFSHAEVGAYLLGLWRLPLPVVHAVAFHHAPDPSESETFSPTIAVYAANILVQEQNPGASGNNVVPEFDDELVRHMGLDDRIDHWRELAAEAVTSI